MSGTFSQHQNPMKIFIVLSEGDTAKRTHTKERIMRDLHPVKTRGLPVYWPYIMGFCSQVASNLFPHHFLFWRLILTTHCTTTWPVFTHSRVNMKIWSRSITDYQRILQYFTVIFTFFVHYWKRYPKDVPIKRAKYCTSYLYTTCYEKSHDEDDEFRPDGDE